jgi:beta-lactamase regulating signal transducer with metallopeptidase domain
MTVLAALLGALLLKPALILAGASGLAAALRRRAAAARHAVWTGAILATLLLPVLGLVLPRVRIAAPRAWVMEPGVASGGFDAAPLPGVVDAPAMPGAGDARELGVGRVELLGLAALALWMLGVVLLGARRIGAEVRVRAMLRRARPPSERLTRRVDALSSRLGVRPRVELRVSDETASPAVAGALHPIVLLPAVAESWADADLAAVLVHELGHVARRDCLLNRLADLAGIVYWCNPLMRWGVRRMRVESERACDDLVVRTGAEPERYARLLLHVAHAHQSRAFDGPLTAMARPQELESRLLAVLDARAPREPLSPWTTTALAGLALVIALPAAALSLHAAAPQAPALDVPEPDRLGDSLALPSSERVPQRAGDYRMPPGGVRALDGPDSLLARRLAVALDRRPSDEADLVRERAYWALARARDGRLVEPLLDALRADDWREQAYAAWALAAARDARALPQLVALLDHPVWRLRAMAAHALRASADPRAERVMLAALTDPAWQVRTEAVEYFAALGGPDVSDRLRPRLDDRHVAVRQAAERALTR